MRTIIFSAVLLLSGISRIYACSSCGCSAANQSIGLLSQIPGHFIGLQYQMRGFTTVHPDDGGMDLPGTSREYYQTYQVTGKYSLGKRVQIFAFVPYVVNLRTQDGVAPVSISGLGDITLLSNVYVIKKENCTWSHSLLAGGGVKMRSGKFDPQSTKTEEGLPNMQPGTHSWDFVINSSYTVLRKAIGFNVEANYAITTANSDGYKFGNRFSTNSYAFYKIRKDKLTLVPQLGVSYDHVQNDYEHYAEREIDGDSGNWQLYASAGIQALYKRYGMNVRYQQPISQRYNSGLVASEYKTEAGIFFLF